MKTSRAMAILGAAVLTLGGCATPSTTSVAPPSLNAAMFSEGVTGPYRLVMADLNDDGNDEAIVRLEGQNWCGSGGCTALVLTPENGGWLVVMRATITRLPFRILETRNFGWFDLGVRIGGGGGEASEVLMPFDGRWYPSNPTIQPARPLSGAPGKILMDESSPLSKR